ncbi:hypothetical protein [Dyella sp.]|uniref:hypothetical protein n=1 Tax=Dyella sp. TaxID=1869338 RepID=UPI002ED5E952
MHPGTQQDQRLAAALTPGYIQPEEFTLAERIRLTLAYAAKLRFAGDDSAGCWNDALLRDETVLLAEVASFPLGAMQNGFTDAWPWSGEKHLWWRVKRLFFTIDRWCQWLARHQTPTATLVLQTLMAAISGSARDQLHEAVHCFGLDDGQWRAMHGVWRMDKHLMHKPASPLSPEQRLQLLRRVWGALCLAVDKLKPLAQSRLSASLASGKHEPAMGLLLTALQLYQDTRAELNRFPERLTDFYYLRLLHMRPRMPAVERVHLCLVRDPRHHSAVHVPFGTRFVGGKDSQGRTIEFAADSSLEVTDNEVAALYSLRLEQDRLISPERDFGYATRVVSQSIPLLAPEAAYAEVPKWWPLLGGQAKGSAAKAQNATLGFALASPLLALKEGDRRVCITLHLSHPAHDDDGIAALLRMSGDRRDASWLGQMFARLERYESRHQLSLITMTDETTASLAQDAWARAARLEGDVQLCYLLARCLAAKDTMLFQHRLGRLFAAWLTAASEDLHPADVDALRKHAVLLSGDDTQRVEIDDPLILIYPHEHDDGIPGHNLPDRGLIFSRVFRGIWQASCSTPAGWLPLDEALVRRREEISPGQGARIEIVMHLGIEQPSVVPCKPAVHGAGWPAQPVIQLVLQSRTRMYAYSLLQQLILHGIALDVDVRGVRDLVLYNQLGRLDAAKPFLPFGPMPAVGSYWVVGNEELSAKPLNSLRLNVRWGQLPNGEAGFAERYEGYPGQWETSGFQVRPEVLRDGQWRGERSGRLELFRGRHKVEEWNGIALPKPDLMRYHRAQASPVQPFVYDGNTRNGFFRLELTAPEHAFGHAIYPRLLTDALTRNARLKKTRLMAPLPQEPYTPVIEQISLDYTAGRLVTFKPNASSVGQLLHLHPFGMDNPRVHAGTDGVPLLPRYMREGNLVIGLSGSNPQGALSLYFHLRPESAAECWDGDRPHLTWSVWCEDGWRALEPGRMFSDGTLGFLRSGIVVLDLPAGMTRNCPRLPGQLYWLRLSADGALERLAGLYGVHTQAISASRVTPRAQDDVQMPLSPGTVKAPLRAIGGLRGVTQVGPSFGLHEPDVGNALRVRTAERLRHKMRASTPWDYERLLLDRFPETYKVKCFANGEAPGSAVCSQPGGVLVVVVPSPRQGALFHSTEAPRFDAAVLERMAAYLRERSTPGVRLLVRNAAYERIQVRCALQLTTGTHPGAALIRINQAIVEFLSPWHAEGCHANFDWEIRAETIEARLRELDDVETVGPISLLHIVSTDDNTYHLRDTARTRDKEPLRRVRPAQPWSLVLPTTRHLIELIGHPAVTRAQATGVGKLAIGGTFILGPAPGDSRGTS